MGVIKQTFDSMLACMLVILEGAYAQRHKKVFINIALGHKHDFSIIIENAIDLQLDGTNWVFRFSKEIVTAIVFSYYETASYVPSRISTS